MIVGKKLDRFKQWGRERMGGDSSKTDTSDEFKMLEIEMGLRQEGKAGNTTDAATVH